MNYEAKEIIEQLKCPNETEKFGKYKNDFKACLGDIMYIGQGLYFYKNNDNDSLRRFVNICDKGRCHWLENQQTSTCKDINSDPIAKRLGLNPWLFKNTTEATAFYLAYKNYKFKALFTNNNEKVALERLYKEKAKLTNFLNGRIKQLNEYKACEKYETVTFEEPTRIYKDKDFDILEFMSVEELKEIVQNLKQEYSKFWKDQETMTKEEKREKEEQQIKQEEKLIKKENSLFTKLKNYKDSKIKDKEEKDYKNRFDLGK